MKVTSLDSQNGEINWLLPGIAAGEAEFIQICCGSADRAGLNRFDVIAETKRRLAKREGDRNERDCRGDLTEVDGD